MKWQIKKLQWGYQAEVLEHGLWKIISPRSGRLYPAPKGISAGAPVFCLPYEQDALDLISRFHETGGNINVVASGDF